MDSSVDDRVSALGIFRFSCDYYIAASKLKRNDFLFFPRLYLYSHSLELVLKAFLFQSDGRNRRGHNIADYLSDAKERGLDVCEKTEEIVMFFDLYNKKDHLLRYFREGTMRFPLFKEVDCEILALIKRVSFEIKNADSIYSLMQRRLSID